MATTRDARLRYECTTRQPPLPPSRAAFAMSTPSSFSGADRAAPRNVDSVDVAVIGGGFYGLRLATMVAGAARSVVVFERSDRFLGRASFNNQARVHGGYHYPRSILTALRAREHYARFRREFATSIDDTFQHVYAIARHQTKVRADEFVEFCRHVGAPLAPAPKDFERLLEPDQIERAFLVDEAVFDAHRLGDLAIADALRSGVCCLPDSTAIAIEPGTQRRLRVRWGGAARQGATEADWVVSATYGDLNEVLRHSGLAPIALIHELTEIAIVRPPAALRGFGITVMDGPFWSCVPFPPYHAYSLSHVRYTPHIRWRSDDENADAVAARAQQHRTSHALLMQRDAQRLMPALRDAHHASSLWEIKTILPRSAGDDSRPILVRQHDDAPGLISVLGAKIDSVYDVEAELRDIIMAA